MNLREKLHRATDMLYDMNVSPVTDSGKKGSKLASVLKPRLISNSDFVLWHSFLHALQHA